MTEATLISAEGRDGWVGFTAAGSWTAEHARMLEPVVTAATKAPVANQRIAVDMSQIVQLDTFGAWLLERALRSWRDQGCETEIVGLRENYLGLFEKVHDATQQLPPEERRSNSLLATFESIGRTTGAVGADIRMLLMMAQRLPFSSRRFSTSSVWK